MANIEKLEDLVTWQKARRLTTEIYRITSNGSFSRDFGLRDQIRRASVSVVSNIAEGYGRGGNKEFLQFLSLSEGSLYEVKTQLYIASGISYINAENLTRLTEDIEEILRMINGLIKYLKSSDIKGTKYKKTEN